MATKKKTKKGESLLIKVVLDGSGSMNLNKLETMGAYNAYVDRMKKEAPQARLSLMIFDSESIDTIYGFLPIDNVPLLNASVYKPRAMTPLYDATGRAVAELDAEEASRKTLVILTDGLENHSREFSRERIKALLDQRQADGWLVIFLGAGFDAIAEGAKFGTRAGTTVTMDMSRVAQTMSSVARATSAYAMANSAVAGQSAAAFTAEEREEALERDEGLGG
jgi:Mg-chelatase subunit ChlD